MPVIEIDVFFAVGESNIDFHREKASVKCGDRVSLVVRSEPLALHAHRTSRGHSDVNIFYRVIKQN